MAILFNKHKYWLHQVVSVIIYEDWKLRLPYKM